MLRNFIGAYDSITSGDEPYRAFIPAPLPPDPPLEIDASLREKLDRALVALGRLDSLSTMLPDISLFIYMYIRKEAVLSSQIEGTQSSLSDLLIYENDGAPGVPLVDVQEVSNYVNALNYGVRRLREGFPLSLRLIREVHEILLHQGRGSEKAPGEFRHSQNWIGGTRPGNAIYVPPPPKRVMECLDAWEKFLHDRPIRMPILIKAALAHVQFETIHPFLDGNGRVGRLLITLLLCNEGILSEPLLYLSLFFKKNRGAYYEFLQKARFDGDWESWLDFFAMGVIETAEGAVKTAKNLMDLIIQDRQRIQAAGKSAASLLRVHQLLERHPVLSIQRAAHISGLTVMGVSKLFKKMVDLEIVRELTGRARGRLFCYDRYVALLNEGTEPIR